MCFLYFFRSLSGVHLKQRRGSGCPALWAAARRGSAARAGGRDPRSPAAESSWRSAAPARDELARATLRFYTWDLSAARSLNFAHRNSGGAGAAGLWRCPRARREGTGWQCPPDCGSAGWALPGEGRTPCRKFAEEFTVFLQIFMLSAGGKKKCSKYKHVKLTRFVFSVGCVWRVAVSG